MIGAVAVAAAILVSPASLDDAVAAVAAGRKHAAAAARALEAAAERHPVVATALWTLAAEAHLARGERAAARAAADKVLPRDARWAARAAWAAARATGVDDCAATLVYLDRAAPDARWVPAAPRLALQWRAAEACGRSVDAREALALDHPETPEGRAAAIDRLWSSADHFRRAEAFERRRMYAAAAAEIERGTRDDAADDGRFRLARLHLERIRLDFGRAADLFERVEANGGPHAEEAAYLRARARGRAGDVVGATAAFRAYLARWPSGRFAEDVRFFSAFLAYEIGRFGAAAKDFAAIAQRRGDRWRKPAAWYHAWALYLAGDAAARSHLETLARGGDDTARRAAYWAARAAERDDPHAAQARWAELLAADPRDWYAIQIRRRWAAAPAPVPVEVEPEPLPTVDAELVVALDEVRALHAIGLGEFARRALRAIAAPLQRSGADAALIDVARTIGDFETLHRTAARVGRNAMMIWPGETALSIWRDAYPMAWPDEVTAAARRNRVDESLWLEALMLKESAFDAEAVSEAHAVGLLQLLPRTARRILDARGESAREMPDLADPAINIELGTWYVAALARRFGGQFPLIAAAYNAGPGPVAEWAARERAPQASSDVFVERIPFKETRRYVKRATAILHAYRIAHRGADPDEAAQFVPVVLDLTIAPGVDF